MKRWLQLAVAMAALAVAAPAGEVIDRIVATVNEGIILQSEWEDAVHYQALVNGIAPEAITPQMWQSALTKLVDQELLRQQMRSRDLRPGAAEEAKRQLAEVRKQYAGQTWSAVLERYGLTDAELAERVTAQVQVMRFIDFRMRPSVHVDSASVEAYYRDKFLPELKRAGAKPVPLSEVSSKIEEVLVQQKIDELLSAWLHNLREQSKVRITAPVQEAEAR